MVELGGVAVAGEEGAGWRCWRIDAQPVGRLGGAVKARRCRGGGGPARPGRRGRRIGAAEG
jgi:hypothetical protein